MKRSTFFAALFAVILGVLLARAATGQMPEPGSWRERTFSGQPGASDPLVHDWPYPRRDLANTAASPAGKWALLEQPVELWQISAPEGYLFGSMFPVAGDVDSDGRAEYVIGSTDWGAGDCWLYTINVEDGSLLWRQRLDSAFTWSTPILVDVNHDGQLDIVLATSSLYGGSAQVMVLNGNDGSRIWSQSLPVSGMGMTVADVDNDGWVEVVVNDYGKPKRIYLLNGQDGSPIWQRETGGSAYNIPTVGDVDGDGRSEILSHNHLYAPSRERLLAWDQAGNLLWTYLASPSPKQEANAPPELGWVPDFGYISTTLADFNGDGEMEIGWGTRCHYYVLDGQGELLWRVPTVEGYGILLRHWADGTVEPDIHGTGGPSGYAAAVGNLDADPALEVVLSFKPEYRADWYEITATVAYTRVTPANRVWALDGLDGAIQWAYEGEYPSADKLERMHEPILVDLTADGWLDLLVLSSDGHLYAIRGTTGEQLMAYPVSLAGSWIAAHLTFVADDTRGLLLYGSRDDNGSKLHGLQIARQAHLAAFPAVYKDD